jgi:glycerol-3-phosphate cytidylyltransferase
MIVLNAMIGDCFHEGHQNLLKEMRKNGDVVVVVVHDDISCYKIKNKFPIQSLERRVYQLEHSGLVDMVLVTSKTDPASEFKDIVDQFGEENIIYMRGDDLEGDFPGKWLLDKHNVKIKYIPYTKGVSSSEIRKKII